MKRIFTSMVLSACALVAIAQNTDTPMSIYLPQEDIPETSAVILQEKLTSCVTGNYITVVEQGQSQFMLTGKLLPVGKEVVGTAPAMFSINLDLVLYVADWMTGKQFANKVVHLKGAGKSEDKAYINAFKTLKYSDPQIVALLDKGREAIIAYYKAEGERIINEARALATMREYPKAFFILAAIPSCAGDVYENAQAAMLEVFKSYIDFEGNKLLVEARGIWASTQSREAAREAVALLVNIDPESASYPEATKLLDTIEEKVGEVSEMKRYADSVDIQKLQIEAARQIGVAWGTNQQPLTTNLLR